MQRVYLDYAATTPIDSRVKRAMDAVPFGNPNSLHLFGQEAQKALDGAREKVARCLNADFGEIVFTGSATEANNLALQGAVRAAFFAFRETEGSLSPAKSVPPRFQYSGFFRGRAQNISESFRSKQKNQRTNIKNEKNWNPKIIISSIEHESIFETARALERNGMVECVIVPVNEGGIVNVKKIEKELDERTVLVSIMYVNNETGSVQPITKISEAIRNFRNSKFQKIKNKQISNYKNRKRNDLEFLFGSYETMYPLFHTDAVQAFQYSDCDTNALGVDMLTLSAHKLYGPKGVGVLYVGNKQQMNYNKQQKILVPILTGGGQEFGMRSGTQNVPGIVGCAEAVEYAHGMRTEQSVKKAHELKKVFFEVIKEVYPRAEPNGSFETCSPYILSVWFPGISNELLLIQLDKEGVAVSTGSACHARAPQASRTVTAMYGEERARESIRFSFGRNTKTADIRRFGAAFRRIMEKYIS